MMGSDCILLIASILNDKQLEEFAFLAESLNLEYIIEVHDEEELKRVENFPNAIIGVNNRNLKTFKVDIQNSIRMRNLFKKDNFYKQDDFLDACSLFWSANRVALNKEIRIPNNKIVDTDGIVMQIRV